MSFSIKQIKAILSEHNMPVEDLDKAAEEICGRHSADLDGIKEERDTYKKDAETLATVQKELSDLKAQVEIDTKAREGKDYDKLKQEFDNYKAEIQQKETKSAVEKAVKSYLKEKNITDEGNLEIFMRGSRDEINAAELDKNGKIKDTKPFDDLIAGTYAKFVESSQQQGAKTANPPTSTGGTKMTVEQIDSIKDTAQRHKAMLENHELYGF